MDRQEFVLVLEDWQWRMECNWNGRWYHWLVLVSPPFIPRLFFVAIGDSIDDKVDAEVDARNSLARRV